MAIDTTKPQPEETPAPAEAPAAVQSVNFALLGAPLQRLDYEPGMTVRSVVYASGNNPEHLPKGTVLHMNGQPAELDDIVEPGSTVMMTSAVKNG